MFSMSFFPIVLIQGSRQVGKSYLLNLLLDAQKIRHIISLDDLSVLAAAKTHPHDFIDSLEKPVGIDEIQRAPELMLALKKYVDSHKRAGDFVLTGSANIFDYPETMDSLCGRIDLIKLSSLTLSEKFCIQGSKNILEYAFAHSETKWTIFQSRLPQLSPSQSWDQVFFGGFPDIVLASHSRFKQRWCESFVTAYIERDLRDLAHDMVSFHKFFQYIGLMSGQQFIANHCGTALQCDHRQGQRYLDLLEMSYQIYKLQPFFSNHIKKLVKSPKIYLQDSGLASWFFQLPDLAALQASPHKGALLETFICHELMALCNEGDFYSLSYFRTADGHEVDFVVSHGDRHLLIECKSQLSTSLSDLKGITYFRKTHPESIAWIMYPGEEIKYLAPNTYAIPLSFLALRFA